MIEMIIYFLLFCRHILNTEDCSNALLMIQPSLIAFRLDGTDEAVLLDSTSIQPDTVLLMDSFFHILIYVGENIAKWRKAGYLVRLLSSPCFFVPFFTSSRLAF